MMEQYYITLLNEGSVEVPADLTMTFLMYCFLQGLFGSRNIDTSYDSSGKKIFKLV